MELNDTWLGGFGVRVATPREAARRGSHVVLQHPSAWQLCQAWKAAGVIPDYRAPERVRIGLAPLYTRFVDVHDAMARLRDILATGAHEAYPATPGRVT
jgi:kynureninase